MHHCRNSELFSKECHYNSDVQIGVLVVLGLELSLQEKQVFLHGIVTNNSDVQMGFWWC